LSLTSIVKALSSLLVIVSAMMLLIPIIDIMTGRPISTPFLIVGSVVLIPSLLISKKLTAGELTSYEAIATAATSWLVIPLISAIAMSLELKLPFIDMYFESLSGFTGTGFSVIPDLRPLKPSIIFWRSLMQWSGELGIVVFAVAILPHVYKVVTRVYLVERGKLTETIVSTAKMIIAIYVVYTLLGLIAYMATGMTFYEAINYIMTTIATGGMAVYNDSLRTIYLRAPLVIYPVMIFMVLGAFNFNDLRYLLRARLSKLKESPELRPYLILLAIGSLLTVLAHLFVDHMKPSEALIYGVFHYLSGATTTGFTLSALSDLSDVSKAVLIMGMAIGGATFSTAGGIKVLRFVLITKNISWISARMLLPSDVTFRRAVGKELISDEALVSALSLAVTYISINFVLSLALSATANVKFIDALFEVTSGMSCVGLSVGVVSHTLPAVSKIILMIAMYLGRLEFVQLYVITGYLLKRKYGLRI